MRLMSTTTAGLRMRRVEHGHQALAARQHSAVLPGIAQDIQRLVELTRRVVVEPGWFQRRSNPQPAGARLSAGRENRGSLGPMPSLESSIM